MLFFSFLAFLMMAPLTSISGAQDKPIRQAELLVFGEAVSDRTAVGIHIVLEPGWYMYWTNPGDAGIPPEVRWRLPAGFEVSSLRYPVPEKIRHGGLVVYGYHDEVLILGEISTTRPLKAGEKVAFAADLHWMVCRESCLLGRESLRVFPANLKPADIRRAEDIRTRFTARFPKSADASILVAATATAVKSPSRWEVEIAFPEKPASRIDDFYPHPVEGFVIDHSRISVSPGKIKIPLTPSAASSTLTEISGTLIVGSTGYEVKVPVR
ncbi:MAG: hypothetical protein A2W03_18555 [Candidatus Aminicenantes bacterium RBG_16_63_16]|nr:MAG: hypothetical protein A2W03_18555 [Candidatus Aminicenantes bacterium RBG_16_63_16]